MGNFLFLEPDTTYKQSLTTITFTPINQSTKMFPDIDCDDPDDSFGEMPEQSSGEQYIPYSDKPEKSGEGMLPDHKMPHIEEGDEVPDEDWSPPLEFE